MNALLLLKVRTNSIKIRLIRDTDKSGTVNAIRQPSNQKDITMTRSTQIREVYAELRHALSNHISARQALEAAASIVDLFMIEEEEAPRYEQNTGVMPFGQWAIDVAMSDGGWRVLGYEIEQLRVIEEQEEWENTVHHGFKRLAEEAYT
jgi:hypothetical protein